jgi:hypothetical protein
MFSASAHIPATRHAGAYASSIFGFGHSGGRVLFVERSSVMISREATGQEEWRAWQSPGETAIRIPLLFCSWVVTVRVVAWKVYSSEGNIIKLRFTCQDNLPS